MKTVRCLSVHKSFCFCCFRQISNTSSLCGLPVSEQEKSLFREVDGPVVDHRVDFCQVFRLPLRHAAQQQVEESASFVTQVVFAPQESLLVFCQTGSRENTLSSDTTSIFVEDTSFTHKQRQCFFEISSIFLRTSSQGSEKLIDPGRATGL